MSEKYYITTPIYYPSGKFHIGTAYTTTLANTIKKYRQMRGYDAYLLTGLDDKKYKMLLYLEEKLHKIMLMKWQMLQKNYGQK